MTSLAHVSCTFITHVGCPCEVQSVQVFFQVRRIHGVVSCKYVCFCSVLFGFSGIVEPRLAWAVAFWAISPVCELTWELHSVE